MCCHYVKVKVKFKKVITLYFTHVSAQAPTFEPQALGSSFSAHRDISTISRSSSSTRVIMLKSRSNLKNDTFELTFTSECLDLYSTKTYLESQGHLKVNVKQNEINFLSIVNVFVIYVLCRWYTFD